VKTVPEPNDDEAMVYEDIFVTGLCMPLHPALADILLHFQSQLHQLTPKAIAQLSKYFWPVGSFGGVPSRNSFVKRYELHYQPKTIKTPEGDRIAQYGWLNSHAKRDGSLKLSLTINNKWLVGWTKSWFYCRVSCWRSSGGGKSIYALHSRMSELDYVVEPKLECPDNDPNDATFVQATSTIECCGAVEEYVGCKKYPLAAGFCFKNAPLRMTPVSKVETPLLLFTVGTIVADHADRVLAKIIWRLRGCW
jgi:hypothetical protein